MARASGVLACMRGMVPWHDPRCKAVPCTPTLPIFSNGALSTEGLGSFVGSVEYTYLGSNTGQLAVSLTDTTDPMIGGYITAFMFRTPESMGAVSSSMLSSSHPALTNIPAGALGSPFPGSWIGGAGTGGQWLAGGLQPGRLGGRCGHPAPPLSRSGNVAAT